MSSQTSYPQSFYQPPDGSTQVLLVRHGQSAPYVPGSPFPLVDGHGDPELTELGHHQAALVGDRLAGEGIGAIYTSTLTRTHQTAAPLVESLGLTPHVDPGLREIFLGEAEGGLFRELLAKGDPAAQAVVETGEWGHIPGAETTADFTARTKEALDRIVAANTGELVAVFCHGGVIAALLGYAGGCSPRVFAGARHTSVNHLVISPPNETNLHWRIRSFNDGAHSGHMTRDFEPHEPPPPRRISTA